VSHALSAVLTQQMSAAGTKSDVTGTGADVCLGVHHVQSYTLHPMDPTHTGGALSVLQTQQTSAAGARIRSAYGYSRFKQLTLAGFAATDSVRSCTPTPQNLRPLTVAFLHCYNHYPAAATTNRDTLSELQNPASVCCWNQNPKSISDTDLSSRHCIGLQPPTVCIPACC
jgi:hypothetical protein